MNILVCVKQVPDTTEVKINQETGTLIRTGVPSVLNPFDVFALEAAYFIKENVPGTKVVAVAMGPKSAADVLREAMAIVADQAYLLTDSAFCGSDTLATAYILSSAIKKIETKEGAFDMIFFGNQAIDGGTAQVGPQVSEFLKRPMISSVTDVKKVNTKSLELEQKRNAVGCIAEISLPCICTFSDWKQETHPATIRKLLEVRDYNPIVYGKHDLNQMDPNRIGLKGSHTKVVRTFVPEKEKKGILISNGSSSEMAEKLLDVLNEARLL